MTERPADAGLRPAEGRDDLDLPGADRGGPALPPSGPPSEHPEAPLPGIAPLRDLGDQPDAPDSLGQSEPSERIGVGMPGPVNRRPPGPDVPARPSPRGESR
jgi:hypothetical protein